MCLDTVGRKVTLKKDRKVWKVVVIDNGGRECGVCIGFPLSDNRLLHAEESTILAWDTYVSRTAWQGTYKSGFHCFARKKDARNWGYGEDSEDSYEHILPFIIPADTTIQHGTQSIWGCGIFRVIVTPVLINPRVTE